MESLLAIGVGLVLRIVVDAVTDNDRVSSVLVGMWEGVVLSHFVRRMPRSFDPYLGFGFRIFVDFLFTQSLSRLALVVLWALLSMLLADIAPTIWRDSGLRHLYRQVRKDVRHVKRAMPHIRIKNDLPSVRLFNRSRSTSSNTSIRSDRAAPSRSPVPSPTPTPGPARRPGRSPPGTFPNVSGWSETGTDVSSIRENIVAHPTSPSIIPSQEVAAYGRDTTRVVTPRIRTTAVQGTTVTITQTQHESVSVVETATIGVVAASTTLEPVEDPSRHDPPTIPDDWVDVNVAAPVQANEPVVAYEPDPDSTPERQAGPSTPTPSRPASVIVPPPAIEVLPDIPDIDHGNRISRPPEEIPLPESRAASVIGGVFDQPQPRSVSRVRSRADKAISELGVDTAKLAGATQSTIKHSTSRSSWLSSVWTGSKLRESVEANAPPVPPKEPVGQSKPDEGAAAPSSEPHMTATPAQVDPPASILTQPRDASPLLLASVEPEPEKKRERRQSGKPGQSADDGGVDDSSAVPRKRDDAGPSGTSLLDLPSPARSPPPPFTEFAGVNEFSAGGAPVEQDPVTQDEVPTELTAEQKVAEENRNAFLAAQAEDLEKLHADLKKKLDREDDPMSSPAKALDSDLEDSEKTLTAVRARMGKRKFTEPPADPTIEEVSLADKSVSEVQAALTSAITGMLLARDDAGPLTIQAVIGRGRSLKPKQKDAKEAVMAFARRYKFTARFEPKIPGIINITF